MNVVKYYNKNGAGIVNFAGEASPVYALVAHGKLSTSQINALAIIYKTFFKKNYINISPNLNIKLGEIVVGCQNELSEYLMNYGLFIVDTDITVLHDREHDVIEKNDKIVLVNIPQGKFYIKQLYDLAVLLHMENVPGIHLINDRSFLFKYDIAGQIDVLKQGIEETGLQLQEVI